MTLPADELEAALNEMAANFNQRVEEIKSYYDQNKDKLEFFKHTLLEKKLKKLIPVLTEIGKRFPFAQLKIVCNDFLDVPNMKVIKKEWSEEDEVADLQSFDIGLGPLTDDVWTRGKCGLKLVQYLAVGVPAVCSPVGANKEIVTNEEVGFWADGQREWVEKLSMLIENPGLRTQMGKKGVERIEKKYSLQAMAPKIVDMLTQL